MAMCVERDVPRHLRERGVRLEIANPRHASSSQPLEISDISYLYFLEITEHEVNPPLASVVSNVILRTENEQN